MKEIIIFPAYIMYVYISKAIKLETVTKVLIHAKCSLIYVKYALLEHTILEADDVRLDC